MDYVKATKPAFIFVQGRAGTGKSTLAKYITYATEELGKTVVNVATTGLAALQMPHGATAHSVCKIPLDDDDN
jgi:ABC-type ATPase involved in cell division